MARSGSFHPEQTPLAWFDPSAVYEGWFDPDWMGVHWSLSVASSTETYSRAGVTETVSLAVDSTTETRSDAVVQRAQRHLFGPAPKPKKKKRKPARVSFSVESVSETASDAWVTLSPPLHFVVEPTPAPISTPVEISAAVLPLVLPRAPAYLSMRIHSASEAYSGAVVDTDVWTLERESQDEEDILLLLLAVL